jgi:homoserine dehydrogenase
MPAHNFLKADLDLTSKRPAASADAPPAVVVLKFGSSVLRSPELTPFVVSEIYAHVRHGQKVVAVVSAIHGQTDLLLGQARALGVPHDNSLLPRYVVLGEEQAAALVAIGCDRVGLDCVSLSVRELGIIAQGPAEDATPVRLGSDALVKALEHHQVVVVPGFGAINEAGRVVLLGRGGTDLTAVFLAAELGLASARLVKDVDGVYDGDPAVLGADAHRFGKLDWATAKQVAGKLVQLRAIDVAEARGVTIEVSAIGLDAASRIGPYRPQPAAATKPRKLKVALAGCGVVGGGVLERLLADSDHYEVVGVLVRDPKKPRDPQPAPEILTNDPDHLLELGADLLVEALSEGRPAERLIRKALARGMDVVTADKQAVAFDLAGLQAAAEAGGARLAYSAAVGGGSPMLETVRAARRHGPIVEIQAVLNGTCNFILDRVAQGASFADALEEARKAGFAEEDPSSDLEGHDAAAKLRILAWEAFGVILEDAAVERVALDAEVAAGLAGKSVKQVGRLVRRGDEITARVDLVEVGEDSPFRNLRGERNALLAQGDDGGVWTCKGRGAGRWPTAESVLADVADVRRASARI